MKVTRDVIYDLLPTYFADEVSADSRALVDEYFATDPEFKRMAERFRAILDDKHRRETPQTEAAHEKDSFARVRARVKVRQEMRAGAVAWALGALFSLGVALFTGFDHFGYRHPGVLLFGFFGVCAVVTFVASYFVEPDSPWRLTGGTR
jgi:anti-sigma factor RsiW